MKASKTEYVVENVFLPISKSERKERINRSVRTLCDLDIEKMYQLDYNISVAHIGDASDSTSRRKA